MSRQISLDTETTGLETSDGHRIIEIGCVELIDRKLTGNNLHLYLQPDRQIDAAAQAVHGISNEFLEDKPRFAQIADQLLSYLRGAELIIHNAPFDVGFIEYEYELCGQPVTLADICVVTDSLVEARQQYPGQRNSLDALCRRLGVNNSERVLHGALLDAEILADVYLNMTGGQNELSLAMEEDPQPGSFDRPEHIDGGNLPVVAAADEELGAHEQWMDRLRGAENGCVWDTLEIPADRTVSDATLEVS